MRVLVAGGGTAGPVFPAIALAHELASAGHEVRFAGSSAGEEVRLVRDAGFELAIVDARPLERAFSLRALAAPLLIELGYDLVLQAVYVRSLIDIATGRAAGWNYVPREAGPRETVPR